MATSTSDLCFATATEIARRIRDREGCSLEVTDAFLEHIAAHNGTLNAIIQLLEEEARARATEADEALARDLNWGPFHGVPVTIKEMFLMANTASTLNSRRLKSSFRPATARSSPESSQPARHSWQDERTSQPPRPSGTGRPLSGGQKPS